MKEKSKLVKISGVVFLLLLTFSLNVLAQTQVRGIVIDEYGEPAIGATIQIKGTSQGTVTDIDGNFTISAPTGGTLVVSYVGYATQEVAVSANVRVVLSVDAELLDDIIVVAYGTARRSSFTGSAATVSSETIDRRRVSNVTKALDGVVPGVQVSSGSGQPGAGSNIFIRGLGSINSSNRPLYVVDGVPFDGDIASIAPNDIESITVLKDASAGALYGARGANGVIMITTRRGREGRTEINVRANFGIASRAIPRYETMNSRDYVEAQFSAFYNQAISNGFSPDNAGSQALFQMAQGGQRIFGANEMYNPFNYNIAELINPTTGKIRSDATLLWEDNWLDEATRNDAWRTEYSLDMSGGNSTTQYFTSFNFLDHNGLLKTTNFKRYSGRVNVQSKPLDWLGIGLGSNFARSESNLLDLSGSASSNVWYSAELMAPIFPVYMRDRANNGNFILDENGNRQFDYGRTRPAGQQGNFNSIATLYDDSFNRVRNNVSARGRVDLGDTKEGWAKGLRLSFSLGVDYQGQNDLTYYNPYFGNAENTSGLVSKRHTETFSYTANQMLSYNFTTQDVHHFDAMLAHEYYDFSFDRVGLTKTGFPFGGLMQPDAATTITSGVGFVDVYRIESYLGRLNYNYDHRYYLSASFRRDASSRFHRDNRWGTFWSIGGNYRISQEAFMQNTSHWLDNLSIRASYGMQGNDAMLDPASTAVEQAQLYYVWQSMYDLWWANANEGGAITTTVENPEVTWEKNGNFNIGFDASMFRNRLAVQLEFFQRRTTDLLLNYPLPISSGFTGFSRNAGSMLNTGLEFTATGRIIRTRDFEWSATLMATTMRNKVLTLTEDGTDIVAGSSIIREGEAFRSWFLPKSAGVDPLTGDQLFWATVNNQGETVPAYITNSSVLANNSRYVAGNMFPNVFGSLSTDLRYKSFDFSIATNYSLGGKRMDGMYNSMMSFYYPAETKHVNLLRAWRQPGDITDIPRYRLGQTPTAVDDWLIDASYFSIRNITLGYSLPTNLADRIGVGSLRLFTSVDNLHMFTALKGSNPQVSVADRGVDFSYTPERMVSFGVDLRF
ncbi:MAG: TonB-dependent receptor [Dysgonamonadaceae bacterium]|jgi:TonB-linked SusC/RagA family outer membrane protein|nr:TonB-dependent receptor [Dysgonamonadaceae bacterium]